MLEPDVTLTDFAIAVECAVLAWLTFRRLSPTRYRAWLLLFFGSIAAAAIFGGITHGYLPDETSKSYRVVWPATMIAIGATAWACWNLGAEVLRRRWFPLRAASTAIFCGYTALVLSGWQEYRLVIADYLPAVFFLLIASIAAVAGGERGLRPAVLGFVLTFIAAAVQVSRVGFPHFNHNALYHAIQAAALVLIWRGLANRGMMFAAEN